MSCGQIVKAYKGEIYIPGIVIDTHGEYLRRCEENEHDLKDVKNKIKQICACTPKDMFPSDKDGDTLWKMNIELDDLFDALNDLEWERAKLHCIGTIVEDWQYEGKKNPDKDWRKICPDPYKELREDFAETIASMNGNPGEINTGSSDTAKELEKRIKEKEVN